MSTLALLLSMAAALAGLISIIIPLRFLGIKTRPRGLAVFVLSFIAFCTTAIMSAPSENEETPSNVKSAVSPDPVPAPPVAEPPVDMRPVDQKQFVKIVESIRAEYRAADTDFKKGATRPARAKSLCQTKVNRDVSEWIGEVALLTTNSEGRGVVEVRISDYVTLKTWNNALSDITEKTLIEPGSKVFSQLAELRSGDKVKVSGSLIQGSTDCFREGSVTLHGSMNEPEFLLRFRSISKL